MSKLLLATDFDGVFNFDASRSQYSKNPDALSRICKGVSYCRGIGYKIDWSAEAIYRLNNLKTKFDFEWLWLSTWESCTDQLSDVLQAQSDGYISWDVSQAKTDEEYYKQNFSSKYSMVKKLAKDRPLVWLEDEATVLYRPEDFNYDNLIITPDSQWGLNKNHMSSIEQYISNNASSKN